MYMLQYCIDYQSGYDHNISIYTVTCLLFNHDLPCLALKYPHHAALCSLVPTVGDQTSLCGASACRSLLFLVHS